MNLYFRLIWTLFRAWRLPKLQTEEIFERQFRVLPNDIDVNLHMNNGRYMTVADLMTIEFFVRTGFLRLLFKRKWKPVAGGVIVTFRRQIKFGQKYRLRYRWAGCDDHWHYFLFEFLTPSGTVCAKGYSKGAMISHKGLINTDDAFAALDAISPDIPLPEAVVNWKESEKRLMA
jgi:acyl-CoA thioesterase FadM